MKLVPFKCLQAFLLKQGRPGIAPRRRGGDAGVKISFDKQNRPISANSVASVGEYSSQKTRNNLNVQQNELQQKIIYFKKHLTELFDYLPVSVRNRQGDREEFEPFGQSRIGRLDLGQRRNFPTLLPISCPSFDKRKSTSSLAEFGCGALMAIPTGLSETMTGSSATQSIGALCALNFSMLLPNPSR